MATSEDFIDTFYNSIRDLHSVRKSLTKEYAAEVVQILERAAKDIADQTGGFLQKLDVMKKHDQNTLKKMISASPSSLSHVNEFGQLPIQKALRDPHTVGYVPLLAKEGVKYNVGGEGKRGGLLLGDPADEDGDSTLHLLGSWRYHKHPWRDLYDEACVGVMKELRHANLLTKEDIKDCHLLYNTCQSEGKNQRFAFLCDWCPEGMKDHKYNDHPMIHAVIKRRTVESFAMFLKSATTHHANDAGLLFQTDDDGITAYERAFDKFGKEKAIKVTGDCIPFDDPQVPILHHVAKHTPQFLNEFSTRYKSAMHLRDNSGRNLDQAMLTSGNVTFNNNALFLSRTLSDDDLKETDPATELYPFMVAATGNNCDLSAVYVLLKRNPSLALGEDRNDGSSCRR